MSDLVLEGSEKRPEWYSEPCMLGIDEAGRGPILGPMVYGCAFCPISYKETLGKIGFADSKQLTEAKRDSLYDEIMANNNIGWSRGELTAEYISAGMLRKTPYNLNAMSFDTAYGLIQKALDDGVNLVEVYVDTVGKEDRYEAILNAKFTGIKCTVRSKADSLFPVVSAASIVAKVSRDRFLRDIKYPEDVEISRDIGSGYPGDPATKKWVAGNVEPLFGYPRIVRFSWQTTRTALEEHGAKRVKWECEEDEDAGPKLSFGGRAAGGLGYTTGGGRHSYFKSRKMQRMAEVF